MKPIDGLTLGHIPYLNCVPFFHYLNESGFSGKLVSGVPSTLNTMLQQRTLDISPSSSFEYARHWQDYLLLPGHSISSIGKVQSVLLFSPVDIADLEGWKVAITGESATSINLLRIIMLEFMQFKKNTDAIPSEPVEKIIAQRKPALLIGDRALRMAADCPAGIKIYDLGDIWYQHTALPFVFALWMIRKGAVSGCENLFSQISEQLQKSYDRVMQNPLPVAELFTTRSGLPAQQIVDYWHCINYQLEETHIAGLRLFFDLCEKHNLLANSPSLEFFQLSSETANISS